MVNVMGDALATGIMAHICRKDFVKEGEQVRACKAKSTNSEVTKHPFVVLLKQNVTPYETST